MFLEFILVLKCLCNHFHSFPNDEKQHEQRIRWIKNVQTTRPEFVPTPHSRLCSIHFDDEMFETRNSEGRARLKSNAVPTKFFIPKEGQVKTFRYLYTR